MTLSYILGSFITVISIMMVGGFLTMVFMAHKGMLKDDYIEYIFDDEDEEIEILD